MIPLFCVLAICSLLAGVCVWIVEKTSAELSARQSIPVGNRTAAFLGCPNFASNLDLLLRSRLDRRAERVVRWAIGKNWLRCRFALIADDDSIETRLSRQKSSTTN